MSRMRWRQILAPGCYVLMGAIALVFLHSAIAGETGWRALREAEALKARLQVEHAEVLSEDAVIRNRVERLKGPVIDPDLLDERARIVLGLARTEDLLLRP
ncbi:MAG: septum formation initiator family protein [Pseudomonadota bacterium]